MSSWMGKIFGGGIGELADGVAGAIDRFVETEQEKRAAELLLLKAKQDPAKWQAEITKAQVVHRSIFVAGARPFLMWICGLGLAFAFLINPLLQWLTGETGPELPTGVMMELVVAMLGLSGLRTVEKLSGRAK